MRLVSFDRQHVLRSYGKDLVSNLGLPTDRIDGDNTTRDFYQGQ
jgi:hypothetical protein